MSPADFAAELADGAEIITASERRQGEGETELVSPACERGCSPCYRECALRGIQARLWRKYLAKASAPMSHAGITYSATMGSA